ncbi:DUF2637 domain-containing protein [Streptantibioticus parmotrematis]|uniref:DUF2637 domain-containing protein n=1 Tax=Streptantibioticus parmotrematis TaxID=2873249 RepID=UPI00340E18E9
MLRPRRFDPVLVQAVIAGALSFAHLHDLAAAAGQHGWKAWAYPVSVDLLLVAAWRRMRTLRAGHHPARAAWTWFIVALTASLGANVATAGLLDLRHVPALLRIIVAGWPALAFLGGTLLAHTTAPDTEVRADERKEEAASERFEVEREPEPAPVPQLPLDDGKSEEPAPAQLPSRAPVEPPVAPAVPTALVDHARKVADAHRAATGADIDTHTLRARLGVTPALADAITAQLA